MSGLLEAIEREIRKTAFVAKVRDAEKVEIKATPWVDTGTLYAMDASGMIVPEDVLYVVCHPTQEDAVREAIEGFRGEKL